MADFEERYYSAKVHTETERRREALDWLAANPRPKKKLDNAGYWRWWRVYHFALNDETWQRFMTRARAAYRPGVGVPKKRSPSSGHPAYRQPGHPLHEEFLSHARAWAERRKQDRQEGKG